MADPANTGIYEIVNTANGKRYIGSAVNFRTRWNEHRRSLNDQTHHNAALKRSWKKYGAESFMFRVLVLCERADLIEQEQRHIDSLKPEYNICKVAGSTLGFKPSEETRKKFAARMLGNTYTKGVKFSPEICARMGAGKIGKKRPPRSEEHRKRISEANKGHQRGLGRLVSAETRAKIAASNAGKVKPLAERLKRCTLSEEQVRKIRDLRVGGYTFKEISAHCGVRHQLARLVCIRKRYEWVDPDGPSVFVSSKPRGGWKRSAESNAKIGAASKARWSERRAAGTPNPKHRSPRTPEQRTVIAAAARKAWDRRRAAGETKRSPITEEQRENYRASASSAWARRKASQVQETDNGSNVLAPNRESG